MKNTKKILISLISLVLCTVLVACGSPASNAGDNSTQSAYVEEDSNNEEISEAESTAASEDQTNDAEKSVNVGIIPWSLDKGDKNEFVNAVKTTLSEQYADQINDFNITAANQQASLLPIIMENMLINWEGQNTVILILNDENGFSDEELLSAMNTAEKAGVITGVDHAIEGAPESTFLYDESDAAGCAALIIENAFK